MPIYYISLEPMSYINQAYAVFVKLAACNATDWLATSPVGT